MTQKTRTGPQPTLPPAPSPTLPPYRRRPWLLLVAIVLFLGWISWLAVLVATGRPPIVLSHPQMLAAVVDVVAHVEALDQPVRVQAVLWPENFEPGDGLEVGKELTVVNLEYCTAHWSGPGDYLLPLRKTEDGKWVVAPTAPSPGYPPPEGGERKRVGLPRIYPDTPSVRQQHARLRQ